MTQRADWLDDLLGGYGLYQDRPLVSSNGKRYQCNDGLEYVYDGALGAWRPMVEGVVGYQPPLSTAFAFVGPATGYTALDVSGQVLITAPSQTAAVGHYVRTGGNFVEVSGAFEEGLTTGTGVPIFPAWGSVLRNGATPFQNARIWVVTNESRDQYEHYLYTDYNGANGVNFWQIGGTAGRLFVAVRLSGGNVLWQWTRNPNTPQSWNTIRSVAQATVFSSGAPNQSGVFVQSDVTVNPSRLWLQSYNDG